MRWPTSRCASSPWSGSSNSVEASTYTDLYLPIDARQERLLAAIDGERTIEEICRERGDRGLARAFFQQLWRWDQFVFNTSRARRRMI
jgi:hypothetical protein